MTGLALIFLAVMLVCWSAYLISSGSATEPSVAPAAGSEPARDQGRSLKDGRSSDSSPRIAGHGAKEGAGRVPTSARGRWTPPAGSPAGSQPFPRSANYVAPPISFQIPALDLRRPLVALEVVDGTLEVPQRWDDVGWWEDGPNPGAAGSSVFVGHVDSKTGPAVFYGLSSLRKGDEVHVRRLDETTATFRVDRIRLVDRNEFPSEEVYRLSGRPTLHLITCGGNYDDGSQHYDGNVVVTAHLVKEAGHDAR